MNGEIRMVRHDNTPWGFRLTGGKDFESPFFVVKVLHKSIAEKAGLRVGDLVWAINYQSTEPYTHKDSQRVIYESGNKLILNIRRGCPMPGRETPLPEYTEPLMEVDIPSPPPVYPVQPIYVPPYYPQQQLPIQPVRPLSPPKIFIENKYESTTMKYESTTFKTIETTKEPEEEEDLEDEGEDVEAAYNITIKPSGRISKIEEIETPPSRPSSRSSSRSRKSRSRSPSRERKKSLPKPILKVTTNVPDMVPHFSSEVEETENVTIKKSTERKHSKGSVTIADETKQSKEVTDTKEGKETIERKKEIKDRTQLTDEDIAEMMSGEAEVLEEGVIGVNFQKFIPKVDFIKDSEVLQALQEETFRKEVPEEKQLVKEPTKRFSTFLQTPKRPIPKPKPRPDNVEDLPWKRKFLSPTPKSAKQQKINDTQQQQQQQQQNQNQQQQSSEEEKESAIVASASQKETSEKTDVNEAMVTEESEVTEVKNTEDVQEINSTEEEQKDKISDTADNVKDSEDNVICNGDTTETTDVNDDDDDSDEKKSVRFEDEVKEGDILMEFQSDTKAIKKSITLDLESCKDDFERQLAHIQQQLSSMQDMPEEIKKYLLEIQEKLFNVVKLKTTVEQEKAERERRLREEQEAEERRKAEEEEVRRKAEEEEERRKAEEEERRKAEEEAAKNAQNQQMNEYSNQDGVEYAVAPPRRKEILQTPQVRPIVLPGGKKWRKPQDAYTDEFIAETLVGMSEVIVGSTLGTNGEQPSVNFWKYIPPKFDTSNSAVYRLIQENEDRCKGIAGRPEKVLAEEDYCAPISKRHFYAAKLAEMAHENVAQQPLEPGA